MKYVPCGAEHLEARPVPDRAARRSRLRCEVGAELGEVGVGQAEPDGRRVLERAAGHVGEELLGRAHRARRAGPGPVAQPDLPAGEAEGLAGRADGDGPLPHAGEGGDRDVLDVVEGQVLVDLVGHDEQVVLLGHRGDGRELGPVEHLAGRVVGRVEEDEPGTGRDGGPQGVDVEREVGRPQRDRAAGGAGHGDAGGVAVVVRLEGDGLVAGRRAGPGARRRWPRWRRTSRAPAGRGRPSGRRSAAGGRRRPGAARARRARAGTGCPGRRRWRRARPGGPRPARRCRGSPDPG